MTQVHYLPRSGPMQKASLDYSGFLDLKTESPVNHSLPPERMVVS